MNTYLGYYRINPNWATSTSEGPQGHLESADRTPGEGARTSGEASTRLHHRGVLRSRAVGAVLSDPGPPSVLIVETSDDAHLSFINSYYSGWPEFLWVTAAKIGGHSRGT